MTTSRLLPYTIPTLPHGLEIMIFRSIKYLSFKYQRFAIKLPSHFGIEGLILLFIALSLNINTTYADDINLTSCKSKSTIKTGSNSKGSSMEFLVRANRGTSKFHSARILSTSPLYFEIANKTATGEESDSRLNNYDSFASTFLEGSYEVGEEMKSIISSFTYGDEVIFAWDTYLYGAMELAQGKSILAMRSAPSSVPEKLLIGFSPPGTNGNEQLLVYSDGSVYFRTKERWVLDQRLTTSELEGILFHFEKVRFDRFPDDYQSWPTQPTIVLSCQKFKMVSITKHSSELAEIVETLTILKNRLLAGANRRIAYAYKYKIYEWPYKNLVGGHGVAFLDCPAAQQWNSEQAPR